MHRTIPHCSTHAEFFHESSQGFKLFYLSRPDCSVCKALLPRVTAMAREKGIPLFYADLDVDPALSGQLSIFSIPALLLYIDGKEFMREARFMSIEEIGVKLDRLIALRDDES